MAMSSLRFDPDLIRRHDCHGPRYTSYPTAVQFHSGFDADAYRAEARKANESGAAEPLSLYVHIPFCASPCFYCACNRIITRSAEKARTYLDHLYREVELQAALFSRERAVGQLHFGGGTPTFLRIDELAELLAHLGKHFRLTDRPEREYSIEIDPRTVQPESVRALAALGFNRMSLGVQDFDPAVQEAINRVQSARETLQLIDVARSAGFGSVSVDLIYGLPRQTPVSFERTLETVLEARPDRLAVYAYAHMPQVFKAQRRLRAQELPSSAARLELLRLTIETLTAAGYVYVGMDHFALPGDELVRAREQRTLHRNFQGYSTHANCDLVGLGVSAIGRIGRAYAQNFKTLPEYYAAIASGRLAVQRGVALTPDDRLRRAVIQELMCNDLVDFRELGAQYEIDFDRYFSPELERLRTFEADRLVQLEPGRIVVTGTGRLLLRNIAMVFDAYLAQQAPNPVYSQAI